MSDLLAGFVSVVLFSAAGTLLVLYLSFERDARRGDRMGRYTVGVNASLALAAAIGFGLFAVMVKRGMLS